MTAKQMFHFYSRLCLFTIAALAIMTAGPAGAASRTWVGPANGDWFTANNWNPNDNYPQDGDAVAITNGTLVLTNTTAFLDTLTITNANTVMFFTNLNAALQATNVFVRSGALLRHYPQSATTTNASGGWDIDSRVYIICSNLTVDANGTISATTNGYAGGLAGGAGYGPGGGPGGATSGGRGNGGAYGGQGGVSPGGGTPGMVYGSAATPTQPGSGGGGKNGTANTSGIGGGLIVIQASGLVTVNGTISCAGGIGLDDSGGGGSGGGIYVTCGAFAGAGVIAANGGTGPGWGAPGGGGRIAIVYNAAAQALQNQTALPTVQFSANYAAKSPNGTATPSRPGTLYLTDSSFLSSLRVQSCEFAGVTNWAPGSLTITNRWLIFPNFTLAVTNDLTVGTNGVLELSNTTVSAGGSFFVTNTATVYARAGATNGAGPDYGALIAATNQIVVSANGTIFLYSHPYNGGSVLFRATNVVVATGGNLNADGAGFAGGYTGSVKGYGPGGSTNGSNSGGAGYGGRGGAGSGTPGGPTYGDPNAPMWPGSGAGTANGSLHPCGGGLVRIDATGGKITLNGTLSANGQGLTGDRDGGASGGGIFLKCQTIEGNGAMAASGGNGGYWGGGGGGAGRVAIWYMYSNYTGTATSTGGVKGANASAPADNGTNNAVVWVQLGAPPIITNNAATNIAFFSASLNATLVSTGTAPTFVSVFWGPTDGGTTKTAWPNTNSFTDPQMAGSVISTNIVGLTSGASYTYRYYASNSAGEAWAPLPTSFTTTAGLPVISNAVNGATGVTLTSATLNGNLVSAGTAATSLKVFWGPTDGGTNWGAWANTNSFAGTQAAGLWSTNVSLGTSNIYYFYTFYATNSGGDMWATPSVPIIVGGVTLVASNPNAKENGPNNTGTFAVFRPASLTNLPLAVNYTIDGTAINGTDYQLLTSPVIIPAGATSNTITITPIMDAVFDSPDKWVRLTLAPGNYMIGTPSSGTVTIQDVAPAATNTFTGTGDWQSATNWSDGIPPLPGQGAVINGSATLSNATAGLSSLMVMSNKTLTFATTNAIVYATTVTVAGTITHNVNTATNSPWTVDNYVHIVCTNLTVLAGGAIDVTGKGYQPPPTPNNVGYGPGGGFLGTSRGGGGAYGGRGGGGQGMTTWAVPYGSAAAPALPGSSGASANGGLAGAGGGLIRVEAAGTVTVNGALTAGGGMGVEDSGGGGSGGGIYVTCAALAGSGTVTANGGKSTGYGAPGGGGRIAVIFDPVSQDSQNQSAAPTVVFGLNPGVMGGNSAFTAWPGTVYLPNSSFLQPGMLQSCEFAGFTNLTLASAAVTGKWWVTRSGFTLAVTNGFTLGAAGRLDLSNGVLAVGGDLILTNSATLITQSGVASNSALVSVFGTLYVGSNCTIYPYSYPTNSSAPLFTMRDLLVATGGTINADAKGYASNLGTGHGISGSGAGYGGQGGQELYSVNHWAGGITYGSSNAPVDPGSGGGKMLYDVYGGGLVTVQASGNVRIDGTITANGQSDLVDRSGGGSGGGIYIKCWKFYGGGSLSANGGSTVNYSGGGGGGGRIAVWMQAPLHTVSNTVNGGIGYDSTGQVGTVVFGLLPPPGTIWTVQ